MDEGQIADVLERGYETSRPVLREFIVDFLGSLVPGVVFLVGMGPALVVPVWALLRAKSSGPGADLGTLIGPNVEPPVEILLIVLPLFLLFLAAAYVFGHLFFRQDPKKADEASFRRIAPHTGGRGMVRRLRGKNRVFVTPVEFPYHFLRAYLNDRGISYLAELVPWGEADSDDADATVEDERFRRRAKHFANALKLRIQIASPKAYSVIARNEAHVRLSASMWYVARVLAAASTGGIVILLGPVVSLSWPWQWNVLAVSPVIVLPIGVFLTCYAVRRAIEQSLHYQREREVLFILETAHWLRHTGATPAIFHGLTDPSGE